MRCLLLILTAAALLAGGVISGAMAPAVAAEPAIALVSKVILDVKRKEASKDWIVAKRGETLASGDMIRTGDKSVAIIKFKDNSLVRVREKSEVTVTGTTTGSAFSKSIDLLRGTIGFNVKKQTIGEEFRFTSPTSVASIRGTEGLFTLGDTLTVIEGRVRFKNKFSLREVDVDAGFTAISYADGTIQVRPSTAEEKARATSALREEGQDNKLELDFRDNQGNKKQLKIDFK
jgi:hypothetical protein